jgi:hypothetical protein
MRKSLLFSLCLACLLGGSACQNGNDIDRLIDENYNPVISPSNFVSGVQNPYFPINPGKKYTYTSQTPEGNETIVITMLPETKTIMGVVCMIIRDVVSLDGVVIEDTFDWYAQDKHGNVWYMGEDVSNYENGKLIDKDGSFEAGIDGAKPGIVMLANPILEFPYRQEYYFGKAEDWGKVVAMGLSVTVPAGKFDNCIKTEDWNALEPKAPREFKYYAPGIGVIKEEKQGSTETVVLTKIE